MHAIIPPGHGEKKTNKSGDASVNALVYSLFFLVRILVIVIVIVVIVTYESNVNYGLFIKRPKR